MQELLNKVRKIELKARRWVDSSFAGEYHTAFKGRGLEFDEVRPYQYGDDVRNIDWNVTARAGEVYVKQYREEREQSLFVLFDISKSQDFGKKNEHKLQVGIETVAILGFSALRNSDKFGLATFTTEIESYSPPKKGKNHILSCLQQLLIQQAKNQGTSLGKALNFLQLQLKKRHIIVIISDFMDQGYESKIKQLSHKHEIILIRLFHPAESLQQQYGILPYTGLETGKNSWVYSHTLSKGGNKVATYFNQIEETLHQLGKYPHIGQLTLDLSSDYITQLELFFKKRNAKR